MKGVQIVSHPMNIFLGQKMCSVAPVQTDTKVNTEDTLSGFQEFFLQPIIKDRSNIGTANISNMGKYKKGNHELLSYEPNGK